MNDPSTARTPATMMANRLYLGELATAGLFMANSDMRAWLTHTRRKSSTKVRRAAHAAKLTRTRSRRPNHKAFAEHCHKFAATSDLSERKHDEIRQKFRYASAAGKRVAIGVNYLLRNFRGGAVGAARARILMHDCAYCVTRSEQELCVKPRSGEG
jgi:hypothetical protein